MERHGDPSHTQQLRVGDRLRSQIRPCLLIRSQVGLNFRTRLPFLEAPEKLNGRGPAIRPYGELDREALAFSYELPLNFSQSETSCCVHATACVIRTDGLVC